MGNVVQFVFEEVNVRTQVKEDGSIWFVAKDVCDVLGLGNPSQAISRLREKDKDSLISNDVVGRTKEMTIVSEFGLYELVLGSRKENAQKFKYWICDEVIPSIRKTGSYGKKDISTMDMLEAMFKQYREQETRRMELERKVKAIESKQEVFLKATEYFSILAYAKIIGVTISLEQSKQLGRKAAALCRKHCLATDKVRDPRFGHIGAYPEKVLDEIFAEEFATEEVENV